MHRLPTSLELLKKQKGPIHVQNLNNKDTTPIIILRFSVNNMSQKSSLKR